MVGNVSTLDPFKVVSIRIFRARLIDRLVGKFIKTSDDGKGVNIPFDIDDMEVPDEAVVVGVDKSSQPGVTAMDNIKAGSLILNPLNWQNIATADYKDKLRNFRRSVKDVFVKELQGLASVVGEPARFGEHVQVIDVTPFTTIQGITRDIEFGASCTLSISLVKLREMQNDIAARSATDAFKGEQLLNLDAKAVPRENDVVEILVEYSSGKLDRLFLGFVSVVNQDEQRGQITSISIACGGFSKPLTTNRMVTDRAIIDQFEDGETAQNGLSVVAGGTFRERTVDQIFTLIMTSQLSLRIGQIQGDQKTRLLTEQSVLLNTRSILEARMRELTNSLTPNPRTLVNQEFSRRTTDSNGQITTVSQLARRQASDGVGFQSVQDLEAQVKPLVSSEFVAAVGGEKNIALPLLLSKLVDELLVERYNQISKKMDEPSTSSDPSEKNIGLSFQFDQEAFTNTDAFQLVYIPLITMMAVRNRPVSSSRQFDGPDHIIAKFSGRRALAFDQMIRKSFNLFFSQISTPNSVLDSVRTQAKFVVYENEWNQIVCEIPRYNEFGADPAPKNSTNPVGDPRVEKVEDFIILNPLSLTVGRQDTSLVSRMDVRGYIPLLGESPLGAFTMGQYTDIATIVKYGMRVDYPAYNVNASWERTIAPFMFAAVELAAKNAMTRTATAVVPANRTYKLGRLYFITRQSLDTVIGGFPVKGGQSNLKEIHGYVGYLAQYDTNVSYGDAITHTLGFRFVRKARLLRFTRNGKTTYVANFKVLPDISGVIDALESSVNQGLQSTDVFNRTVPENIVTGTAEILRDTTVPEDVYVSDIVPIEDRNAPYLDLRFLHTAPPQSGDKSFNTTSTRASHHLSLAPNIEPKNRIAVIKVDSTTNGIQRETIRALGLIDIRLRALNRVIFAESNRFGPGGSEALAQHGVAVKRSLFKAVYVPTEATNPYYRIAGLRGLKMSLYNVTTPGASITNQVIVNATFAPSSNPNQSLLFDDFSIASGEVFRLDAPPHFAVLRFRPQNPAHTTTFGVTSAQLKLPANVNAVRNFVATTTNQIDPAIVTQTIDRLPAGDNDLYIPVIFHTPDTNESFIGNVDPGVPLSVYDSAHQLFSSFRFSGLIDVSDPDKASDEAMSHKQGRGIDISLFPWFARTGLVLKNHDPYILLQNYAAFADGAPALHQQLYDGRLLGPISVSMPTAPLSSVIRQTPSGFVAVPVADERIYFKLKLQEAQGRVNFRSSPKNSAEDATVAKNAFLTLLQGVGLDTVFLPDTDLNSNDKFFYHLET